jgi:hypothetical protein
MLTQVRASVLDTSVNYAPLLFTFFRGQKSSHGGYFVQCNWAAAAAAATADGVCFNQAAVRP